MSAEGEVEGGEGGCKERDKREDGWEEGGGGEEGGRGREGGGDMDGGTEGDGDDGWNDKVLFDR